MEAYGVVISALAGAWFAGFLTLAITGSPAAGLLAALSGGAVGAGFGLFVSS